MIESPSKSEAEKELPNNGQPGGCAALSGSLALAEMAALEKAIADGEADLRTAHEMVANIHRKQAARRQELGYQKARMGMKLSRASDTPIEGGRMVIVQTDGGIATRWIRPENVQRVATADETLTNHEK